MKSPSVFLLNDTSVSGHPGCVTVMSVIRENLEMRGLSIAGSWPMGAEPHFGLSVTPALRLADAVVVNGEGTLHNTASRPGARRLLHCLKRARAATAAPIYLVNATLENLRPQDFARLALCEGLFVRDEKSRHYAESHGLMATVAPDLCFSASPRTPLRGLERLVTDSTLPGTSRALRRWSGLADACYLPMQPSRLRSMLRWSVAPLLQQRSSQQYISRIAAAASLVTGRFHAVVFALIGETPFLALGSNTSKVHSLLGEALGSDARLIHMSSLHAAQLDVPAFSAEERARIRAYRAFALRRSQGMFDRIAQSAMLHSRSGGWRG